MHVVLIYCREFLVNSHYIDISRVNKYNNNRSLNKSYCLISQSWGENQLHEEEKTTQEETVQLTSVSPSRLQQLPNNAEIEDNGQLKMC